jgi:hypothetical protein
VIFQIGDIVKGNGEIPFDCFRYKYIVTVVLENRIGKPCWLQTISGNHYPYPVPSELLVLVKRVKLTPTDILIKNLEKRVEAIERLLKQRL